MLRGTLHPFNCEEFNKKFRGSDDFKKSVAEDKIESFGNWVVKLQILFIFTPKIGKDEPILTNIFQRGRNYQLGKVLQKFFDTEREDYKKDAAAKIPDYDYLVKKAGQAGTTEEDKCTMSPCC